MHKKRKNNKSITNCQNETKLPTRTKHGWTNLRQLPVSHFRRRLWFWIEYLDYWASEHRGCPWLNNHRTRPLQEESRVVMLHHCHLVCACETASHSWVTYRRGLTTSYCQLEHRRRRLSASVTLVLKEWLAIIPTVMTLVNLDWPRLPNWIVLSRQVGLCTCALILLAISQVQMTLHAII